MTRDDPKCRVCGVLLVIGENVTQNQIDHSQYICRSCRREHDREYAREYNREHREHIRERGREYRHRIGRYQPMSENRQCPAFLGVCVAERVLSHVFKHVERMPYGNTGFDFICGHGYMVDVKGACRHVREKHADNWMFTIRKNKIAEYFLCLAFDNRNDLNPEHVWLIPANDVNDRVGISIAETTLTKWDQYKLDVEKVSACCNILREVV